MGRIIAAHLRNDADRAFAQQEVDMLRTQHARVPNLPDQYRCDAQK